MNLLKRLAPLVLLGLFAFILVPFAAGAASGTETITVQVNTTTPNGTSVIGTLTVVRHLGTPILSDLSFDGMVNGKPVSVAASGIENWPGSSASALRINTAGLAPVATNPSAAFSITSVSKWNAPIAQPALPFQMALDQSSPGLVTINGVPLALSGPLPVPGSGDMTLSVANAGKGPTQIANLPNTGAGPGAITPLEIASGLIGLGLLLVLASRLLAPRRLVAARVSVPAKDK